MKKLPVKRVVHFNNLVKVGDGRPLCGACAIVCLEKAPAPPRASHNWSLMEASNRKRIMPFPPSLHTTHSQDPIVLSLAYNTSTPHPLPPGVPKPELGTFNITGVETTITRSGSLAFLGRACKYMRLGRVPALASMRWSGPSAWSPACWHMGSSSSSVGYAILAGLAPRSPLRASGLCRYNSSGTVNIKFEAAYDGVLWLSKAEVGTWGWWLGELVGMLREKLAPGLPWASGGSEERYRGNLLNVHATSQLASVRHSKANSWGALMPRIPCPAVPPVQAVVEYMGTEEKLVEVREEGESSPGVMG